MKKLSTIEKMLAASLAFTFLLLAIRVSIAHQTMYLFYVWNLFLAAIPLVISRRLGWQDTFNFKSCLLLMGWLLFFPNAPYIITDIFHYENRPPLPMWFDLLLVLNAAWSGLMFGLYSLLQVELFLSRYLKPIWVSIYIKVAWYFADMAFILDAFSGSTVGILLPLRINFSLLPFNGFLILLNTEVPGDFPYYSVFRSFYFTTP